MMTFYNFSIEGLGHSSILQNNDNYLGTLSNWLKPVLQSKSSYWKRCWRASVDGWAASTFHSGCDNKGPTVTIIKVGQYIFGGYASVSWSKWLYLPCSNFQAFRITLWFNSWLWPYHIWSDYNSKKDVFNSVLELALLGKKHKLSLNHIIGKWSHNLNFLSRVCQSPMLKYSNSSKHHFKPKLLTPLLEWNSSAQS